MLQLLFNTRKKSVDVIHLDLNETFDRVNQVILLNEAAIFWCKLYVVQFGTIEILNHMVACLVRFVSAFTFQEEPASIVFLITDLNRRFFEYKNQIIPVVKTQMMVEISPYFGDRFHSFSNAFCT